MSVLAITKSERCETWGVELNPWLVAYSKFDSWRWGQREFARFRRADLWKTNLADFTGVVIFGTETLMPDLTEKIKRELKSADDRTFVVACRFPIASWEPEAKFGQGIDTVWLYRVRTSTKKD